MGTYIWLVGGERQKSAQNQSLVTVTIHDYSFLLKKKRNSYRKETLVWVSWDFGTGSSPLANRDLRKEFVVSKDYKRKME